MSNNKTGPVRSAIRRPLSRRRFLRGSAGAVVGLPFLASLRASADEGIFPTRLVILNTANGVVPEAWFPTAGLSESDFTLGPVHQSLVPFQDRLTLFSGINMPALSTGPGEPHQKGMGGVLTGNPLLEPSEMTGSFVGGDGSLAGWGSSISVDQRVAQHFAGATPLPSLHLGVRANTAEVRSRISYRGAADPVPPINDPTQTFEHLFSDLSTDGFALAGLRARRQSVLDAVSAQAQLTHLRLSATDRARMELHFDGLRQLESRLAQTTPGSGQCVPPLAPGDLTPDSEDDMPAVMSAQMDMLAFAFACDITRVATFQCSNAQNNIRFPWLDKSPADPDNFEPSLSLGHSLSHAGPSSIAQRNELVLRDTWYAEQVASLLARLDALPEGNGTVLDHTLFVWVNELAVGNTHSHINMPFLCAGSAQGAFTPGRYLQYAGASHCDFLVSILRAFGIDDATFGDPAHNTAPLSGWV